MKYILYICIWIVGGHVPMKAETRTPLPDTFVRDYQIIGYMKEIQLTQGYVALVDDDDYDYLMQWKWFADKQPSTVYVGRSVHYKDGEKDKCHTIKMHRVIMNTPDGMVVDHIDHNGLNNQKSNLRNVTGANNRKNRVGWSSTGYIGVNYDRGCIRARIRVDGDEIYLGAFKTVEEAARVRDEAAIKYFGEFANLNFKDKQP